MKLTDEEFQKKVLDGVDTTTKKTDQLTKDFSRLDTETKKAFEDLTKAKNGLEDQGKILVAIQKAQTRLALESRSAFGDPIQRIEGNEELRTRFNAAVRSAVAKDGDLVRVYGDRMKALGEDSSPGSTLINAELAMEIYHTLETYGVWNTFGVRRLSTKQTKYPVQTARPVAKVILTEGDTIDDDTTKAGTSVTLEAEVIAVLLNVSLQLLQDADADVTRDVMVDFMEALAYRMDFLALQADGTADADHGGMTGVFEGGTAAAAAAGNITVETLDFEDVTRCLTTVDSAVLQRPACWWIHPQILVRMLHIKDNNGRPIFLTANEAPTPGAIGSILGYPVKLAAAAPSTNAADAKVAVFGDPAAMVVGIRQDFEVDASDHHKWNTYQRSFRGIGRAGVKIRRAEGLAVLTLPSA